MHTLVMGEVLDSAEETGQTLRDVLISEWVGRGQDEASASIAVDCALIWRDTFQALLADSDHEMGFEHLLFETRSAALKGVPLRRSLDKRYPKGVPDARIRVIAETIFCGLQNGDKLACEMSLRIGEEVYEALWRKSLAQRFGRAIVSIMER